MRKRGSDTQNNLHKRSAEAVLWGGFPLGAHFVIFNESFKFKNALVVGGSGGIGKEISLALAASGANVTIHGGHNSKKFDSLMQKMNSISNSAQKHNAIVLDFTKINLENFAASTSFDSGKPAASKPASFANSSTNIETEQLLIINYKLLIEKADILCLCYGPFLQKSLQDTTPREWLETTKLNLALPGILAGIAAPCMRARGFGRILFFGGTRTNTINGFKTNAAYAAAKTGIASLAKSFALEFGQFGVTSNAIFPGFVETEYISPEQKTHYEKLLGGKMISPKEVAQKALELLSNPNSNGNLLEFDKGWQP